MGKTEGLDLGMGFRGLEVRGGRYREKERKGRIINVNCIDR